MYSKVKQRELGGCPQKRREDPFRRSERVRGYFDDYRFDERREKSSKHPASRDVFKREKEDRREDIVRELSGEITNMAKGGMVKKTGLHLLHKGEKVIPRHLVSHSAKKTRQKYGGNKGDESRSRRDY